MDPLGSKAQTIGGAAQGGFALLAQLVEAWVVLVFGWVEALQVQVPI